MPPTRREQLELDELLSDIYRGIETLPDRSSSGQVYSLSHYSPQAASATRSNKSPSSNSQLVARTYVKEYELPASSPIVKQHKQELAALREAANSTNSSSSLANNTNTSNRQPQRSTLKRQTTNTPEQVSRQQQQPQSLASFVTSTTPENRRRVRIVDPYPDRLTKGAVNKTTATYSSDEDYDDHQQQPYTNGRGKQTNVKYVNTNKLIYHQEQNHDDEQLSETNSLTGERQDDDEDNSQDDLDGVTRVEYYHTTWLDRQLGRASKRRSSKELNERQVKEKAMIEELKRSLKNGAITLRQSFKGKKNHNNNNNNNNSSNSKSRPSETYDDQMLSSGNRHKESTVFGSGLATIPRNYHKKQHDQQNNSIKNSPTNSGQNNRDNYKQSTSDHNNYYRQEGSKIHNNTLGTPKQTTSDRTTTNDSVAPIKSNTNIFDSCYQPVTEIAASQQQQQTIINQQLEHQMQNHQQPQSIYSRTLPHNYQPSKEHQLLQSHYRGDKSQFNTLNSNSNNSSSRPVTSSSNSNMGQFNNNCGPGHKNYGQVKSPINQTEQQEIGNTISSIPSATEVVRSALSRSSSQISLNQLNKTINLLPQSPPPYGPSPMTPTHQLRPTSPSLSPSPVNNQHYTNRPTTPNTHYTSKTMGHQPQTQQQHQQQPQQTCLYGTRTTGRAPQQPQPQLQQHQQQQPVYANPHASLMQHKMDQQMNKSAGRNTGSIREFNELDSMLRALSPASSVQITPAYNVKSAQPSFGYGYTPAAPQQQQQPPARGTDIYAKVQKNQQPQTNYPKPQDYQQHYNAPTNTVAGGGVVSANQALPYTIDVTENKTDAQSCIRAQELSEFEPPIELLPSMEDYQNISKLNPVKNHFWYKPNMSRDRAIYLLRDKPQGTFIVRDSTSFKGAFGLAVKVSKLPKNITRNPNADPSTELIRHFLIVPTSNGVQLKGYANEPVFSSLPNLIYQHSLTELALPCKLLIPRADIEDQKFNQKQKQFYDEFIASKEQAKHSPYDRTSPNGGYRKYPGDVYVHNEHRIIFE